MKQFIETPRMIFVIDISNKDKLLYSNLPGLPNLGKW
jgi:hypothetical protein